MFLKSYQQGYNYMEVQLYNSLTNKIESFSPITSEEVKIYSCGPTVYDYPHIGNYRSFVFSDFIHRFFKLLGYKVQMVMNITDIDDKTIKASVNQKTSLNDYTDKYTKAFFSDLKKLNFLPDKTYPKATDHIKDIITMITTLVEKKIAYEINGSVYFAIAKFKDYGKLSNIDINKNLIGEKNYQLSDEYQKENIADFVLWKAHRSSDGGNYFPSPWGLGRPGWHIECSVMSKKYLGEHFDIHTGGIDNCFPHHENEIAQSEIANDKKFVNYWMHVSHLLVENEKMSKSLNNFYTLNDLLKKGYNPLSLRYMLISTHYRNNYNFTFAGIQTADTTLKKVNRFIQTAQEKKSLASKKNNSENNFSAKIKEFENSFINHLKQDFNISAALGAFFDFINFSNKNDYTYHNWETALSFIEKANAVLGVFDLTDSPSKIEIPHEIEKLLTERNQAKRSKDFALADKLRDEINQAGYLIEDRADGSRLILKR